MPGIVLAAAAALLDLLAVAFGWHGIRVISKPLPALILAAVAWRSGGKPPRTLALGLVLAAVGDELLLSDGDAFFMAGMLAFAAMQIAYILCFTSAGGRTSGATKLVRFVVYIPYAVVFIAAQQQVVSHAGPLRVPVFIYSLLLTVMSLSATSLAFSWTMRYAWPVALGGIVFLMSDLTLAAARFAPGFPLTAHTTELAVMGTYFLAQLLITLGITNAAIQNAGNDRNRNATVS